LLLMTTRNHVWSNNGDIANDLEWPLTAPSTHFCKFWGFCPFSQLTISRCHDLRRESDDAYWASEPDRKLKFPTFENPRWRSLTDEHLTAQHWQPVFLFSKPIVSIHVCCSYIELSRQNCTRRAIFRLGIDTFANILVFSCISAND